MDIKSITRTAAIMYADSTMTNRTTNTIKRKFIESAYVNNNNAQMTLYELANRIHEEMGLLFSEDEIKPIVKDSEIFIEVLSKSSEDIKYNLQEKRYSTLSSKPVDEIDQVIDTFFSVEEGAVSLTKGAFKELIYRYLHSVLNTNIAAYSQFIKNSKQTPIPRLNSEQFEDNEIDVINEFIKWDNEDKNKAIFKLVNYCIEYAVVVNNSSEDVLSKSLRTKVFYLDNALIYRALGINGETRKKRTLSFLKKCKESGQKFVISKYTRMEFFNTIEFHLNQLNSSTPFGRINPHVFKRYANGDGFYQFYHEWRNGRINYGFDVFKTHIHTLYKGLVKKYDILEDFKVPFNENDEPEIIDTYKEEIKSIKKIHKDEPHLMDARNMYWLECARNGNCIDIASTKYYFVTSDQKLQLWDSKHSVNQPLTLLPSQWMGLILKYVSRSSDDYKSFISFMNLPKDNSSISEDELQSVMAGISEMTEEFSRQESIIEDMVEIKFGDILKGNIQENAKAFAKNRLEKDFAEQMAKKEEETIQLLADKDAEKQIEKEELMRKLDERMAQIEETAKKHTAQMEREHKTEKLKDILKEIGSLESRKKKAENYAWDKLSRKKWRFTCILVIPICIWIYIVCKSDWSIIEPKTYLPPIIYALIKLLHAMIYGRSIDVTKYFEMLHIKYKEEAFSDFEYNASEHQELIEIRDMLKTQLNGQ